MRNGSCCEFLSFRASDSTWTTPCQAVPLQGTVFMSFQHAGLQLDVSLCFVWILALNVVHVCLKWLDMSLASSS